MIRDMVAILDGKISNPSITIEVDGQSKVLSGNDALYFAMGFVISSAEFKDKNSVKLTSCLQSEH